MQCNDDDLEKFGSEHYTYINQFFGDVTVRQIISETFPNEKYDFEVKETGEEFEDSHHHFIREKLTGDKICSVDNGYQNIDDDIHDTLCQSYSLLTYFEIPISEDKVQRQMDMIGLYKRILSNKRFIKNLNGKYGIKIPNDSWSDYTVNPKRPFTINKPEFFRKMNSVLNDWRRFGYWYYIGKGKCPTHMEIDGGLRKNISKQKKETKKTSVRKTRKINKKKIGGISGSPQSSVQSIPLAQPVPVVVPQPLEETEEKPKKNTVTVKIYPNNSDNNEMIIGDYRIVVDKKIPSDINIVDHFLTNTMKYIKSHSDKVENKKDLKDDTVFFPNTEFKYVFSPNVQNAQNP